MIWLTNYFEKHPFSADCQQVLRCLIEVFASWRVSVLHFCQNAYSYVVSTFIHAKSITHTISCVVYKSVGSKLERVPATCAALDWLISVWTASLNEREETTFSNIGFLMLGFQYHRLHQTPTDAGLYNYLHDDRSTNSSLATNTWVWTAPLCGPLSSNGVFCMTYSPRHKYSNQGGIQQKPRYLVNYGYILLLYIVI